MNAEIRPLQRGDDRSKFSCGESALDRFFVHYAGQNQFKLSISMTYVAVADGSILGFATVSAGELEAQSVPNPRLAKRLPRYPLPVLRLARLAVDRRAQGRGLGRDLLEFVLRLAVEQRDSLGCLGVVTDARRDAVDFYLRHGFHPLRAVAGALRGNATPMLLEMGSLLDALESSA